MKRTPLNRRTPLRATETALRRSGRVNPKRSTKRRRAAPQWDFDEWVAQGHLLAVRAEGRCEICGLGDGPFERHHRKRRRDGGDRLCNLLHLCRLCHKHVTEHPAEARKYGWIVSAYREPDEVPVLWRRREWFSLDDGGAKIPLPDPVEDAHDSEPADHRGSAGPLTPGD